MQASNTALQFRSTAMAPAATGPGCVPLYRGEVLGPVVSCVTGRRSNQLNYAPHSIIPDPSCWVLHRVRRCPKFPESCRDRGEDERQVEVSVWRQFLTASEWVGLPDPNGA